MSLDDDNLLDFEGKPDAQQELLYVCKGTSEVFAGGRNPLTDPKKAHLNILLRKANNDSEVTWMQ